MNKHILMGLDICKNYKLVVIGSVLFIFFIYMLIAIENMHIMSKINN